MSERKPKPPRDDAELAARVEAETRPAPWTPEDRVRFREGVETRVARRARWRARRNLALAGSLALAAAAALFFAGRAAALAPAPTYANDALLESYDEQVLFAPERVDAGGCEPGIEWLCGAAEGPPHRKAGCLLHTPRIETLPGCRQALGRISMAATPFPTRHSCALREPPHVRSRRDPPVQDRGARLRAHGPERSPRADALARPDRRRGLGLWHRARLPARAV